MRNITTPYSSSPPSAWHSPVPFLFGAVVAIVTLIAFALVVLACSHWRHSNTTSQGNGNNRSDSTIEEKNEIGKKGTDNLEDDNGDKVAVIMAGENMPSYIAKPTSVAATT
ncbi:hypothetical protein SUGI_0894980 [Cryptomeria japonica]|nr:hypothetical protein SUGI_0894980 [Cryptomeria japonica]